VPVGPVRMSTLRQKATAGAIDGESLVWREGFEEWLPLKTFPELAALVAEAKAAGGRPSFAPAPAPGGSGATPHPGLAEVSDASPGPVFGSSPNMQLDEPDDEDAKVKLVGK